MHRDRHELEVLDELAAACAALAEGLCQFGRVLGRRRRIIAVRAAAQRLTEMKRQRRLAKR